MAQIIIKPLVTEKQTKITEKNNNRYGFIVRPDADKLQIKKEVESLYNVKVEAVNTARYAGKRSSRYTKAGLVRGQKPAFKKAYVTLKGGDSIDFYSNI
ncbi:50S ribosomal protein L23 [Hallella multisaccharivorax DSM 17128]|uniref:Large ribosomal subunit protein uL23 n=1 Tax=Hallella multisaccharivorax DSM 17128 TaxID=688246 RepID=F8NA08_9BACT|nr:50S ribosomal protein L23 [Hallella multisaccharivorax]EGN55738.1 LSU ribosomal protein L23P [Hallella multisaccharivorax DSM 17128]GJG29239.1 50S ribosomal protein L23 [Hallella multisaccharivorax DSM 17128]